MLPKSVIAGSAATAFVATSALMPDDLDGILPG